MTTAKLVKFGEMCLHCRGWSACPLVVGLRNRNGESDILPDCALAVVDQFLALNNQYNRTTATILSVLTESMGSWVC